MWIFNFSTVLTSQYPGRGEAGRLVLGGEGRGGAWVGGDLWGRGREWVQSGQRSRVASLTATLIAKLITPRPLHCLASV
ncbi:hypothetical protein E2C01_080232 [Portunus trituberculatus]|uniref:Uncharacterized protein n=1 Tax=Portunus trituberculatus TaxID=210409 RepID=A0A5B7IZ07_PORTR|nr:hypothetical protein [Portunus trituberculatus]